MYRDFKSEEKLIDALNIYQEKWVESLPDDSELEHITFSKKFENRIHKLLINKEKEQKENKEGSVIYFSTTFKRVTSLLLASVMFVVIVLFSVAALRGTFFGFLKGYNNDTATVIYPLDDPSYNPYIAFEEGHFAYIPSGFERKAYNYSMQFFHQEYVDKEGNFINIHQGLVSGNVITLSTEDSELIKVDLFGSNAFYYKNYENHLYWQYGSSYYLMVSNIPIEEMLKIAQSLY